MIQLEGTVVEIADGDSFYLDIGISVRLAAIDAPELDQEGGEESKRRLSELLPIGSEVKLLYRHRDRYDRIVAIVMREDININLQMVLEGQAIVYWQYLEHWIGEQSVLFEAEKAAKRQKRGVWSIEGFVEPRFFREMRRK